MASVTPSWSNGWTLRGFFELLGRIFETSFSVENSANKKKSYKPTGVVITKNGEIIECLAILCDLFGMVKWPFKRQSDLQLGDQKVTLNHLVTDIAEISWNH